MEIIVITNRKGGCGKTSTATALASYLGSVLVKKVLIVDADSQCNASYALGGDLSQPSLYDVLTGIVSFSGACQEVCGGKVCLLSGSDLLSNLDNGLSEIKVNLKAELQNLSVCVAYDYVVIDTAPALGLVTALMLSVANKVVVPISADVYNLQGIQGIKELITEVNPEVQDIGVLITRFRERYLVNRRLEEMINTVTSQMNVKVYQSRIREGVVVPEAALMQQGLFEYDPKGESNVAQDYKAFVEELLSLKEGGAE